VSNVSVGVSTVVNSIKSMVVRLLLMSDGLGLVDVRVVVVGERVAWDVDDKGLV
jgi:hypothetical protein